MPVRATAVPLRTHQEPEIMLELARRPRRKPRSGKATGHYLSALERKVLWLACWMIHHANHIRENRDGSRSAVIRRRAPRSRP